MAYCLGALDILARLVEDRPNTIAGASEDCRGIFCIYCGGRPHHDFENPAHRRDCPVKAGKELLCRIYGEDDE